jgi:uncharacterized protein (TIGR03067 family)
VRRNPFRKESHVRTLTLASVFCLLILPGARAGKEDAPGKGKEALKKEIERLRGTWGCASPAGGGAVKVRFAIYGDESFEINIGGAHLNGEREIDPAKDPKEITLTQDVSKKTLRGIYKLEGDTLTLCFGEERPTEFKARKGVTLWKLKREKRADE